MLNGPLYENVAPFPGPRANPANASVCIVPCFVEEVSASMVPFGVITKNSEFFEIDPSAVLGTHPPLGVVVEVRATMWKIIVALPVFSTYTLSEFGVSVADVSWNLVISQIASLSLPFPVLFFQSSLSPTCG